MMRLNFRTTMIPAALLAATLLTGAPATAQELPAAGGQKLEGAWAIEMHGDGNPLPSKTSGFFTLDGTVFIQNTVPDPPGVKTIQGVGEWVRSGNREFDLTWFYVVVDSSGNYFGTFKDRARIHYNSDGTMLEGNFTFELTLADGSKPFGGTGKFKATRVRIEPLP